MNEHQKIHDRLKRKDGKDKDEERNYVIVAINNFRIG